MKSNNYTKSGLLLTMAGMIAYFTLSYYEYGSFLFTIMYAVVYFGLFIGGFCLGVGLIKCH